LLDELHQHRLNCFSGGRVKVDATALEYSSNRFAVPLRNLLGAELAEIAGPLAAQVTNGRLTTSYGTESDGTPYLYVYANS
jgi:hypothetical protein